jgi:hypothetical protein
MHSAVAMRDEKQLVLVGVQHQVSVLVDFGVENHVVL